MRYAQYLHSVRLREAALDRMGPMTANTTRDPTARSAADQRAVRTAYEAVFVQYPDANWANASHFVKGNRGGPVNGCDLFEFRNGKIAVRTRSGRIVRPECEGRLGFLAAGGCVCRVIKPGLKSERRRLPAQRDKQPHQSDKKQPVDAHGRSG